MRNLCQASDELERRLQELGEPSAEDSVVLGYVDGAEICLMGWIDRPLAVDVRKAPTHANQRDSMQIVLSGGMEIFYPDEDRVVALGPGDCHVVPARRLHACVSKVRSRVIVAVGVDPTIAVTAYNLHWLNPP